MAGGTEVIMNSKIHSRKTSFRACFKDIVRYLGFNGPIVVSTMI